MSLVRTLLQPVAHLAGAHAARQGRAFLAAHRRTVEVQDGLLRRLLAAAAGSDFARDHRLDRVRTHSDLAAAVPLGDYETHRPYIQRALEGRAEALFAPGTRVLMFAVTSGTTGAPKHIPVTEAFLRSYRRGWNVFGMQAMKDHPAAWLRKIVTIVSSAREGTSPGGVPCGAITGLLAQSQKWIVRRMYPVPPWARDIHEAVDKYYTILRTSAAEDVAMLTTANPSSAIRLAQVAAEHAERLIADVRDGTLTPPAGSVAEAKTFRQRKDPRTARRLQAALGRDGSLSPKNIWDLSVLMHWTGGTVGLYLPQVRRWYGDVPIRDIGLLASEGRMSVPLQDGTPAGVAEITGNFLEFVPVGEAGSPGARAVRAHEVEVGQEYFIILTNWAGLWRYNIDDRVRVTGRLGQSPVIEFLSKGLHTSSITGEKLTEHQVVEAMGQAQPDVPMFTLQGRFADPPYYELKVDANVEAASCRFSSPSQEASGSSNGDGAATLAARLDECLRRINLEYDQKRSSGRLGPVRATVLPPGSFAAGQDRQLALRRGRGEQYKHKYLLTEVATGEERQPAAGNRQP